MEKYKNKYRIPSARLQGWDYRNAGAYFITICTHQREHFFGEIKNDKMILSTIGAIIQGFWFEIPKHFDHVQLGEFVVMPNHLHGVLILSEMDDNDMVETLQCNVSTTDTTGKPNPEFFRRISPKSGSVSRIIGSFKSICTKHIRQTFPDLNFKWQERFHDHIIRDERSFLNISNYIVDNPRRWEKDNFFN
jgi:REP element-mobilizing transposase RayT